MGNHRYAIIDGERQVHMGGSSYVRMLCGLDMVKALSKDFGDTTDKIDCPGCTEIWRIARLYKRSEFAAK